MNPTETRLQHARELAEGAVLLLNSLGYPRMAQAVQDYINMTTEPKKEKWNGEILPTDFKVETYYTRNGWGGARQAVRVTHVPTGLMEDCCEYPSPHKSKEVAFDNLMLRLNNTKP